MLAQLRERILSGELQEGEALPTEQALSESLSVGRSSVREALRVLEAQGLVESVGRPLSRIVSIDGPTAPLRNSVDDLLRLKRVSRGDLHSLRLALEIVAARAVAVLPEPRDFARSRRGLEIMHESIDDQEAFAVGDSEFHSGLLQASHNELVQVIMHAVADSVGAFVTGALGSKPRLTHARFLQDRQLLLDDHQAILDALVARDGDRATMLLIGHIERHRD
ncbi:FadR family transcriptional regulator [Leucobacter sp. CSA1]|uniref:FadR family transcriptional regulator n=1 Tax=Leucobacter chromiisoli TaxID=2796471 RepID=A0A934QAZ6_9MICO|nr:FCD domain-containing protein [Leucobacter chromiisoli]MBK0420421.1 FadR family transcriptional regulator [Leucobacter chromiisoli]